MSNYILKQSPEDFKVTEILKENYVFNEKNKQNEDILLFKLDKKDYNTISAIQTLAQFLQIPPRAIGFAGNKDRHAITSQYITIRNINKDKVMSFNHDSITISFVGYARKMLHLGNLEGNFFEIILRKCEKKPNPKTFFINYFGEQRFSISNVEIGKALLKKDFKKALELILKTNLAKEKIEKSLNENPNDYIGALNNISEKIISLFLNSFQSHLWNKIVSKIIKQKNLQKNTIIINNEALYTLSKENEREEILKELGELPLIGFETELENCPYKDLIEEELKKEGITQRDFIINQLKRLSLGGSFRNIITKTKDIKIQKEKNYETYKVCFNLGKGSYATVLIRQLFT